MSIKAIRCPWLAAFCIIFLAGGAAFSADVSRNFQPHGWKLIWQSNFLGAKGTLPNKAKWTYDLGGSGWGNHELERYTNSTGNVHVDGQGHLVISAIKLIRRGKPLYTSARIKSEGLFSVKYGLIAARIKLLAGIGLWPAFWMLGSNIKTVGWPKCGELDIMENVANHGPRHTGGTGAAAIQATVHGPFNTSSRYAYGLGIRYHFPPGQSVRGYHIYGMIWTPRKIKFFVDSPSNVFGVITRQAVMKHGGKWVFDHPFFILLNLAVGGNWPGPPNDSTRFPARMYVNWVRVYQLRKH